MKREIWKPIKGWEKTYEISSLGRVRSLDRLDRRGVFHKGIIRKIVPNNLGYSTIFLRIGDIRKLKKIHRLVAEAFIPNPENKPEVNHKDGVKANNHVDNLEWVTKSENELHAYRTGAKSYGERHPLSKLSDEDVINIRLLYTRGDITQSQIADYYRVNQSFVSGLVNYNYRKG